MFYVPVLVFISGVFVLIWIDLLTHFEASAIFRRKIAAKNSTLDSIH